MAISAEKWRQAIFYYYPFRIIQNDYVTQDSINKYLINMMLILGQF